MLQVLKEKMENSAKNLLASEDLHKERLNICLSCQHLYEPTGNCKLCYCFVRAKTKLKGQSCPIKKW